MWTCCDKYNTAQLLAPQNGVPAKFGEAGAAALLHCRQTEFN